MKRLNPFIFLSVGCLLVLNGCGGYSLSSVKAYKPTYQDFAVDLGNRKVDVLFVVDSSGSMAGEQATLERSFSGFISEFAGKPIDFHVGVITTDTVMNPDSTVSILNENGVSLRDSGNMEIRVPLSTFGIFDGPGSLFVRNINTSGVIIRDIAGGYDVTGLSKYISSSMITPGTEEPYKPILDRFKLDAVPGVRGSGNEAPLLSVAQFLQADKLNGWNSGFIRSDSLFSVVIVSDEDESFTGCYPGQVDPLLSSAECLPMAQAKIATDSRLSLNNISQMYVNRIPAMETSRIETFNHAFRAMRPRRPALLSLDVVVASDGPITCSGADAVGRSNGDTLKKVSRAYNRGSNKDSKIHDLCQADFSPSIRTIGNVIANAVEDEFVLDADRIDPSTVKVEINGDALNANQYSYDEASNTVKVDFGDVATGMSGQLNIRIYYDKRIDLSNI